MDEIEKLKEEIKKAAEKIKQNFDIKRKPNDNK